MPNLIVTSLNTGEVTPQIDCRSDVEKYMSSCRTLENMLPLVYGGVTRRAGTKYVNTAKVSTVAVKMVPFIYSSEIAYTCEFGNEYIRFYYDGEPLLLGGVQVEVASPYLTADLWELQFRQIADVMWITHQDYAPRKLSRTTVTSFSLDTIVFKKGPFLTRNDIANEDGVTLTSDVTAKDGTGTLTASANTFESGHVGSIWKLIHPLATTSVLIDNASAVETSSALDVKGTFSVTSQGTWVATILVERNDNGAGWEIYRTYKNNIALSATETADNIQYRVQISVWGSGTIDFIQLQTHATTRTGIVRIDSVTSALIANITVLVEVESTNATARWAEGAWSNVRGYPATITFFEDRAVYGGSTYRPQTVWLSETGDYENFEEGVSDADSFSLTLTTTNAIRWVEALEAILVGTAGDEWAITSNRLYAALTPTNWTCRHQQTYGSAAIQPVRAGKSILFVDSVRRKVRELTYSLSEDKYTAPDLTAFAEHITEGGITWIALQKNPDIILWCGRSDGMPLSMTYERDHNTIGWARHPIQTDAVVDSGAVIPGDTEDEVWLSTRRPINGSTLSYIEQMQPRLFDAQEDAFFVDCGVTREVATAQEIEYAGYAVRYGGCTYGIGPYGGIE